MDIIPCLSDENTKLRLDITAERREAITKAWLFPHLLLLPPLDLLHLQLLTGTLPFSGQSLDISGQRLVGRSRLVQLLAKHCVDLCQAGTPTNTTRGQQVRVSYKQIVLRAHTMSTFKFVSLTHSLSHSHNLALE